MDHGRNHVKRKCFGRASQVSHGLKDMVNRALRDLRVIDDVHGPFHLGRHEVPDMFLEGMVS